MKLTRLTFSAATLAALTSLSLFGCSGGGSKPTPTPSGNPGSSDATRQLLTGNATATSLSFRRWRMVSMKLNTTYYHSTGADQPCPVIINSKVSEPPTGCTANYWLAYRSDGKVFFDAPVTPNWNATSSTFTINGSELTITIGHTTSATSMRTTISEVLSSSVSSGNQRLRFRTKKATLVDGTDRPNSVGDEFVLEEAD